MYNVANPPCLSTISIYSLSRFSMHFKNPTWVIFVFPNVAWIKPFLSSSRDNRKIPGFCGFHGGEADGWIHWSGKPKGWTQLLSGWPSDCWGCVAAVGPVGLCVLAELMENPLVLSSYTNLPKLQYPPARWLSCYLASCCNTLFSS